MVSALVAILVSLALAYVMAEVVRKMRLPRVVGQISAGFILSIPLLKNELFADGNMEILSFLASLGIILLFYYVGLETNFKALTKNLKQSVLISLVNTSLPLILGFLVMKFWFELSTLVSLIIGICLAVSAQSVSIDMLEEFRKLKSKIGNIIIGAGAVDDIIELVLVSVLFSVFHVALTDLTLARLFLDIIFFLVIMAVTRAWLIPYGLRFFDRQKSSTGRFTGSLLIVLFIASLAEFLGLGVLIGAMIAGMMVRQTIFKEIALPNLEEHDIARSVHIIAFGFLIPLFFVSIGLKVDLSLLPQELWFILLLVLLSLAGTVGGTLFSVLATGGTWKEGFTIGWGLSPKGDVELVIALLALNAGIISITLFTSLVAMALVTTIIAPVVFKFLVARPNSRGQ